MSAADMDTIEDILRQYDVDGLLDHLQFSDLVDALRNRESVMIEDAIENNREPRIGDKVRFTVTNPDFDVEIGTNGELVAIWDNEIYKYLIKFNGQTCLNFARSEFERVK